MIHATNQQLTRSNSSASYQIGQKYVVRLLGKLIFNEQSENVFNFIVKYSLSH